MRVLLVGVVVLLLGSAATPALALTDELEALRAELEKRDAALAGELDRAQKREKKAYQKALELIDPEDPMPNEIMIGQKVVKKLKRVLAVDAALTELCRSVLVPFSDQVAVSLAYFQAHVAVGQDGREKARAQKKLDRIRIAFEAARLDVTKLVKGSAKASKKLRTIDRLLDAIPAPDGSRPLSKKELRKLGVELNWGRHCLETMFGWWMIENMTTGERLRVLLCYYDIEYEDGRDMGLSTWGLSFGEMSARLGPEGWPPETTWFAGVEGPMYGSPLTMFWTRGGYELGISWFRWTRETHAPVGTFLVDVQGVDVAYGESAADSTVSLDFVIDWSVADPRFSHGECGHMAVYLEFNVDTGSGFEWKTSGRIHEEATIPFETAEGRYEGRAEYTGDLLWTQRPPRMRLRIQYELEDVCHTVPVLTNSLPLTDSD